MRNEQGISKKIVVIIALLVLVISLVVYAYEVGVTITPPYDYAFTYKSDPSDVDASADPETGSCSVYVHADPWETNYGIAGVAETLLFNPSIVYGYATFKVTVNEYEEGASGS